MIPPPSSVELEELVLLAGIGALSYCAVELVRVLGPPALESVAPPRRLLEIDPRPFRAPVRAIGASILAAAVAAAGARLWVPGEWSHVVLGLGLGLLLVVLLGGLAFVVRATVEHRVRVSIGRLDASTAFLAGARGTAALGLGAAGLVLLVVLTGFLVLQGLDPPLAASVFVVWGAAASGAFVGSRREPAPTRPRATAAPLLQTAAILLAAVTVPMVIAYSDPVVLALVPHAALVGPAFGTLSVVVAGAAATSVRSRPERSRADAFSRALVTAAASGIVGVMVLTAWLLAFDPVLFAVVSLGVGLATGLAAVGGWRAARRPGRPAVPPAVLGLLTGAVGVVALAAFWLGGWSGWPSSSAWDGSLGLFALALVALGCSTLAPALLILGGAGVAVPAEADALPSDPLDPSRGAWRETARATGRVGDAALGTYLFGATALVLVGLLAADVPLVATVLATDTSTVLTLSSWPRGTVLVGFLVGGVTGFVLSTASAGRLMPSEPDAVRGARRGAVSAVVAVGVAVALTALTAVAAGPWSTLGLIPGALAGVVLELGLAARSSLGTPGTPTLAGAGFLGALPLLITATAYVGILLSPLVHWSP